jgi:hypothetical protein
MTSIFLSTHEGDIMSDYLANKLHISLWEVNRRVHECCDRDRAFYKILRADIEKSAERLWDFEFASREVLKNRYVKTFMPGVKVPPLPNYRGLVRQVDETTQPSTDSRLVDPNTIPSD